MEEYFKT